MTGLDSLLARDVRMGNFSADDAREANALLADVIAPSFIVVLPSAGDALHLAVAANHHADAVYTLDETMVKAGKILRLPVKRGGGR